MPFSRAALLLSAVAFDVRAATVSTTSAKCPGSPSWVHAKTVVDVSFQNSCSEVMDEMKLRVAGQASGAWVDPHNRGVYTIKSQSDSEMSLSHLTGNKKYTDQLLFTFSEANGGCTVTGCSESQVTSVLDMSTNYCNLHDLYCSDSECNADKLQGHTKLSFTETISSCSSHQHSTKDCYKASVTEPMSVASPAMVEDDCNAPCADWTGSVVFADMHDGDQKSVSLAAQQLTIQPHANNQTWRVAEEVVVAPDGGCTASIDFNVPGKPSPPPVNLRATFSLLKTKTVGGCGQRSIVFTDPSGTIAKPDFPLNTWIEIS